MPLSLGVHGATGRMGQRLIALASAEPQWRVAAALERSGHPQLGNDAGSLSGVTTLGVTLADKLTGPIDVMIDFSTASAVAGIVDVCVGAKVPLVVATTGLEQDVHEKIALAGGTIPILWSPSMSLAVNLGMKLSEIAGRALVDHPTGVDVEIVERHHRFKEDAPSGTALKWGQIIASAMGQTEERHGRSGRSEQRPRSEIGYHALRAGDHPGEHTVVFGLLGESLEIAVRATSRDSYVHGALAAAKFLVGRRPGLYTMNDVLGL